MSRPIYRLSDAQLRKSKFDPGKHADGGGLFLVVTKPGDRKAGGRRKWAFFYSRGGRRIEIGLGSGWDKPLAVARQDAADARALLERGLDPLAVKRQAASTLSVVAGQYIAAFRDTVKPAVAKRWEALPRLHFGDLAEMTVDKINVDGVTKQLTALQAKSLVIAAEVRPFIERVLDFAKIKGYREGENPARLAGNLKLVMPPFTVKSKHHKSMPYADVPTFYAGLRKSNGERALFLRMLILTGARSTELRLMTWGEVDMVGAIWTIPAERMKGKIEHRVALSKPALLILESLQTATGHPPDAFVFTDEKGRPLYSAAPNRAMDAFRGGEYTPHGFRSSFSCYIGEQTDFTTEMADRCLAHVVDSQVTRAYMRSDLLDKRRPLMDVWAQHVTSA
jgi:integrase